jgi:hypothetical protein
MSSEKPTQGSHAKEGRRPKQLGGGNEEITIACTIELRVAASDDAKAQSVRTAAATNIDDGPKTQTGQGMDRDRTHLPESPFVIRLSFEISNPPIR